MIERTFIQKNYNRMELENYLSKKLDRAGFSKLEIIKTPLVTRIVLHVAKPGLAIGKSGSTIKQLTEVIAQDYKIDNPQIEIQEIKTPNLNAKILSEKIASMLERGFSLRSVSYRVVKDIMDAGAGGVELVFKGAIAGKGQRKRKQRIAMGYMKKIGYQSRYVDFAKTAAYPKAGAIGIKLSIIHPDVIFPDKIDVMEVVKKHKGIAKEAEEQKNAEIEKAEEKAKQEEAKEKDTTEKKEGKEKVHEDKTKEHPKKSESVKESKTEEKKEHKHKEAKTEEVKIKEKTEKVEVKEEKVKEIKEEKIKEEKTEEKK